MKGWSFSFPYISTFFHKIIYAQFGNHFKSVTFFLRHTVYFLSIFLVHLLFLRGNLGTPEECVCVCGGGGGGAHVTAVYVVYLLKLKI